MSLFDLFDFVVNIIDQLGYLGILLGTFLEGVFPPIPSEAIMGFAGFLVASGRFEFGNVILFALLGNFLSVTLIWHAGRTLGREFIVRYGWWIGVEEKDIQRGERLFEKFGYPAVFVCQMIPLARTLIAIPAGVLKTTYWKFIACNSAGAAIWLSFLLYIGMRLGANWERLETIISPYEKIILGALVLSFVYVIVQMSLIFRKKWQIRYGSKK